MLRRGGKQVDVVAHDHKSVKRRSIVAQIAQQACGHQVGVDRLFENRNEVEDGRGEKHRNPWFTAVAVVLISVAIHRVILSCPVPAPKPPIFGMVEG